MKNYFERGFALIVGADQYQQSDKISSLDAVKNDIRQLEKVLTDSKVGGYLPEHVFSMTGKDSTKANILGAINKINKKIEEKKILDPTIFIYFSGHGFHDNNGYYLIPYETDISSSLSLDATAISDRTLKLAISELKSERIIIILDTCHAGANELVGTRPIKTSSPDVNIFFPSDEKTITEKIITDPPEDSDPTTNPVPPKPIRFGHTRVDIGTGKVVMASCRSDEYSYIGQSVIDGQELSVFTECLIEGLMGHGEYHKTKDADEVILITDLMSYVTRRVPEKAQSTDTIQHPIFTLVGESFPIAMCLGGKGIQDGPIGLEELNDQNFQIPQETAETLKTNIANITGDNNNVIQDVENSRIQIGNQNKMG